MSSTVFDLSDRVVVVTGAAGLLGRRFATAAAEAGAHVVAADLEPGPVEALAWDLKERFGHDALGAAVDITSPASVDALRDRILARFDRVDGLVNNAAINDMFEDPTAAAALSRFEEYPLELWRRSLDVNVTGTFLMCQRLGAVMAARGRGAIVNIGSTYGLVAPDQRLYLPPEGSQAFYKTAAYPAGKAAVLGLTRFVAAYWGARGVRANVLSPGGVENGQDGWFVDAYAERTPLGRMARPDDYRGALVFLLSDASAYMTGANLVVDGGWTAW